VVGYLVWNRETNQVIYNVDTTHVDEVQVDKSGRYLVVKTDSRAPERLNPKF